MAGDRAGGVGSGQGHVDIAEVDGGGIVGAVVSEAAVGPLDEVTPWSRIAWWSARISMTDWVEFAATVRVAQRHAGRDRLGDVDATPAATRPAAAPSHDCVGVFSGLGRAPRTATSRTGSDRAPRRLLLADRLDGPVIDHVVEVVVDRFRYGASSTASSIT